MGHVSAKLWAVKVSPAKVSLRESGRGSEGKAGHTQSIERAAAVLRTVARFGSGARLADVVARPHLAKPTAHRILSGLVRPGLWGIGVVVRDAGGKPVGALSIAISGPISPERQKQLALELKREARGISDQLGKTPNLLQRGPTVAY